MMQPLSVIRVRSRVAFGAAAALLLASPPGAGSPEAGLVYARLLQTSCEIAKLGAADSYTEFLAQTVKTLQ